MSTLLSLDPSVRGCGAALYVDRVLVAAAYVPSSIKEGSGPYECARAARAVVTWASRSGKCRCYDPTYEPVIDELALEIPRLYTRDKSVGDPNKLMPLFGIGAALSALCLNAKVHAVVPSAWKGQSAKPAHVHDHEYVITTRVKERLTPEELKVIDWTDSIKKSYDIADAVAIGLHHLGRFERHRVLARE